MSSNYFSAPSLSQDTRLKIQTPGLVQILACTYSLKKDTGGRQKFLHFQKYNKSSNKELKSYDRKKFYGYAGTEFLPTSRFKWICPKEFNLSKYTNNSSKTCVLEVNLEHPQELHELNNDSPLTPDKTEIKREILSDYELKVAD